MTALLVHGSPRRRPGRRRLLGALASLAVAATTFAGLASAAPASASTGSDETGFVASINAARGSAGRPAYAVSDELTTVARHWAQTMAGDADLRHNPRLATQVTGWRFVGENVGVGGDVGSLHRAFMASPAHRANVLDGDFTQVGVGVAYGGGRLWVAEVFRRPSGSSAASAVRTSGRTAARHGAGATYGIGSRGTVVKRIQHRVGVAADGQYGRLTAAAVRRWQVRHHQRPTGVVTPALRRAMHA